MNTQARAVIKKSLINLVMAAMIVFTGTSSPSFAAQQNVDINSLIMETQKMSPSPDEMSLVWWLPEEFWLANFAQDPTTTEQQAEEFVKVLRPYIFLCVAVGKIGTFGGITYETETFLRENTYLIDEDGTRYTPIDNKKIDADTTNLLAAMKPAIVNILGPMGENMHFYLFPSKSAEGRALVNATKSGTLRVKVDKNDYTWRLPLGSLVPLKTCPVDGEKLNGAWTYCPWHGKKLKK